MNSIRMCDEMYKYVSGIKKATDKPKQQYRVCELAVAKSNEELAAAAYNYVSIIQVSLKINFLFFDIEI